MKKIRMILGGALVLLMAASLAGCSEYTGKHWRKSSGDEFVVAVVIPETNPSFPGGNNQEQWFVDAVMASVAELNTHPDITVHAWLTQVGGDCAHLHADPAHDANCIEAWLVPNDFLSATYGPGVAGVAIRLGDSQHYFNGNASNPARAMVANDWSGQPDPDLGRRNAVCHELTGHMFGLEHFDSDDDGNADADGPCSSAHLDRDYEPGRNSDVFDWQALDQVYDTCHNDADGPAGGPRDPDGVNDTTDLGYDECGARAFSFGDQPAPESYGDLEEEVITDGFEHFNEAVA